MNIKMEDIKDCFFDPTSNQIIDAVHPITGGGVWGGDKAKIMAEYPNAVVMDFDAAIKAKEDALKTPPEVITADKFFEMFEVLSPAGWVDRGHTESFKMSERLSGNVTSIYARIGKTYYHMVDSIFTPHESIIAACKTWGNG